VKLDGWNIPPITVTPGEAAAALQRSPQKQAGNLQ
jgi:hypothetical protein